jgi:PEGA domain
MRAVDLAVRALPVLSGCATMIHGTTQEVPITSEPAGAEIRLRGALLGTTPTTLTLERKPDYDLEITKQGYRPKRVRLESVHEHDAASVLLGGLIGWGIDASTGEAYARERACRADHRGVSDGDARAVRRHRAHRGPARARRRPPARGSYQR